MTPIDAMNNAKLIHPNGRCRLPRSWSSGHCRTASAIAAVITGLGAVLPVALPASGIVFHPVAGTGDPAQGADGGRFTEFSQPVVNTEDRIAFLAESEAGAGGSSDPARGIWWSDGGSGGATLAALEDDPDAVVEESDSRRRMGDFDGLVLGDDGAIAFHGTIFPKDPETPPFNGLWRVDPAGGGDLLTVASWQAAARVRLGEDRASVASDVAGIPVFFSRLGAPRLLDDGAMFFTATVRGGAFDGREGLYRYVPQDGDKSSRVLADFLAIAGDAGAGGPADGSWVRFHPVAGSGGVAETIVFAELADGRAGLWRIDDFRGPSGAAVFTGILVTGTPVAAGGGGGSVEVGRIRAVHVASDGTLACRLVVDDGSAQGREELWVKHADAAFEVVARAGDRAPGVGGGIFFTRFGPPVVNARGEVAFRAIASRQGNGDGPPVHGIWSRQVTAGEPEPIAVEGQAASGDPDGHAFARFGDPELNDLGQLVFSARLASVADPGAPLVRHGRWLRNGREAATGDALECVVAAGQPLRGPTGELGVVQRFESSPLADSGRLALAVTFDDGRSLVAWAAFPDDEPPEPVGPLAGDWLTSSAASLAWDPADDNLGVREYIIRRDGNEIARSPAAGVTLDGLAAGERHAFTVAAVDFLGNEGPASDPLAIVVPRVLEERIADDRSDGFTTEGEWGFAINDDQFGYSARVADEDGASARWVAELPVRGRFEVQVWVPVDDGAGGAYLRDARAEYTVTTVDGEREFEFDQNRAAGRWATLGAWEMDAGPAEVSVSREADEGVSPSHGTLADAVRWRLLDTDAENPSSPGDLTVAWTEGASARLEWTPADDDLGVREYVILRDGAEVGRTSSTSFDDNGLTPGDEYHWEVVAEDYAGRRGGAAVGSLALPSFLAEWTVDDRDEGFSAEGDWGFAGSMDRIGLSSRATTREGASATWKTVLPLSGWFEVQVWVPVSTGGGGNVLTRDSRAEYRVDTSDGPAEVEFDQNLAGGRWGTIGAWEISAGPASITVSRDTEAGVSVSAGTMADAVRWVLLNTDESAPGRPRGATFTWTGSSTARLDWHAAPDDLGVREYVVFRDGREVGRSETTSFVDRGLEPGRRFRWTIAALDYAGNLGPRSTAVTGSLPAGLASWVVDDGTPGFTVEGTWDFALNDDRMGGSARAATGPGASARWEPALPVTGWFEVQVWIPASDGKGGNHRRDALAAYAVETLDGFVEFEFDQNFAPGRWASLGAWRMEPGSGAVTVRRVPRDGPGVAHGTMADAVRWVLLDTDAAIPGVPGGVRGDWVSSEAIAVSWEEAADDLGILEYVVRRDGIPVDRVPAGVGRFVDAGLDPATTYRYDVEAIDYSGRPSGPSRVAVAATPDIADVVEIDDRDAAGYSEGGGAWSYSLAVDAFRGYSRATVTEGAWAEWRPDLPAAAAVEVHVWISGTSVDGDRLFRHPSANYRVTHAGGTTDLEFDQNTRTGDWARLGTWDFVPGAGHGLRVVHDGDFGATIADGARFVVLAPVPLVGTAPDTPARAVEPGATATVALHGRGAAFATRPPRTIRLLGRNGAPAIEAAGWTVASDERVDARFVPPAVAPEGVYDLEIEQEDGTRFLQPDAVIVGDPDGDRDGDGIPLALEIGLGSDPAAAVARRSDGSPVLPIAAATAATGQGDSPPSSAVGLAFQYRRPAPRPGTTREGAETRAAWLNGLRYEVLVSDDPTAPNAAWRAIGSIDGVMTEVTPEADGTETVTLAWPGDPGKSAYARLRVTFEGGPPVAAR